MDEQQESSIGFCNSWSDLEKRRKALDLFLLKQFEVVGGVPQKVSHFSAPLQFSRLPQFRLFFAAYKQSMKSLGKL
jgi:hypothetical protein